MIIKQILLLVLVALASTANAFAPLAVMPPTVVNVAIQQQQSQQVASSPQLNQGIASYLVDQPSTMSVSLVERKIPTAEEVAAKKRNFNVLFWGGGFVAPFLATVFYFGPKFWEK